MYTLTSILVLSSRKRVQVITHTRTWIEKIIFLATDTHTCFSLRISSMTRVVDWRVKLIKIKFYKNNKAFIQLNYLISFNVK
jgi:hypothetical protein